MQTEEKSYVVMQTSYAVMQILDFVSGLHNCLELSQPLSCLYQVMQTRKTFSIAQTMAKTSDQTPNERLGTSR